MFDVILNAVFHWLVHGTQGRVTPCIVIVASTFPGDFRRGRTSLYRMVVRRSPERFALGKGIWGFFDSEGRWASDGGPLRSEGHNRKSSVRCTQAGAKLFRNLLCGFSGRRLFRDAEGDRANPGVAAAAVAFANLGQIDCRLRGRPGV